MGRASTATLKQLQGCCRGPEQIVRGDQGQRPGKKSQFRPGSASERGRATLGSLMSEGLGDQVLLLRLYQVCSSHLISTVGLMKASSLKYIIF